MTQERIDRIFNTELGEQLDALFSTSDDRVFIRQGEAMQHTEGKLDPNTQPLADKTITKWYKEIFSEQLQN